MGADPSEDSNSAVLADVANAAANQDQTALAQYMRSTDSAVESAAFDAFSALDNSAAVQTLLGMIGDSSQPNQLQALELLSQSPQIDSQTVMTTLTNALNGGNPILSNYAAQALASLGTSDAMYAVNDAFNGSNTSGQLNILQGVSLTQSGQELLNTAASGGNETVSSAAATWLAQSQSAMQQLQGTVAPINK
jgi:HEAT repeat protein